MSLHTFREANGRLSLVEVPEPAKPVEPQPPQLIPEPPKRISPRRLRSHDYRFELHGITRADFERMFAAQGGQCAICRRDITETTSQVDHDHTTNAVRGLLCRDCNLGLGLFHDRAEALAAAIDYLGRTKTQH